MDPGLFLTPHLLPIMNKQVILYSGGMDSFILASMYPDAMKLYVDVNSKYSEKELAFLPGDVVRSHDLNLAEYERDDAIIPARNMFLALIAAQYGEHIMLGATHGDLSTDKDENWASMATSILRYMFSGKHFQPARDMQVLLPIKDKTKAELVRQYQLAGHDAQALLQTVSCYHPQHKHCGACKSCLRKWVALEYNHIDSGYLWMSPPEAPANWADIIPRLKSPEGWRTPREDLQTIHVLRDHGLIEGCA
jgi:7-cyano-7-deazaguanine synthase in queuosine biosynthesis